jgi:hypothetical protein
VARGIDVTLFATADSITSARLVGLAPTGYSEDPTLDAKVWESLHVAAAFERAGEFDLIHNSADFVPLTYTRLVDTPVVTTIHGFASDATLPVYQAYADRSAYVAISDADRHPALEYAATILHGIDLSAFALQVEAGSPPRLLRSHPPRQGHRRGDRRRTGSRGAAGHRGDRAGRGVLPPRGRTPGRRSAGYLPRQRRPGGASAGPR